MSRASIETLELAVISPPQPSSSSIHMEVEFDHSPRFSLQRAQHDHSIISRASATSSQTGQEPPTSIALSLPSVDGGFGAWSFLTAAFFIEAIVWGLPDSFGVLLEAYLNEDSSEFAKQKNASSLLPLIGPLSSGIMYLSSVIIQPLMARYPYYRRTSLLVGAFLCFASLFGASYAKKVTQLLALQGALYAIGGSLLYSPAIFYLSEWFVTKRGLANGIIFSGTGFGGLILPIILSQLLQHYGPTKTLRIFAISIGCLLIPFLPFLRPRIPPSRVPGPSSAHHLVDRNSWLKSNTFWFMIVLNTIHGFGYFLPLLWLPSFAADLKLGRAESSAVVAVLNAASCIGRIGIGMLSDRFDPWFLALSTLTCTSFATFVIWGVLSHTYGGLIAFGFAYGILAGGWPSLWTGFTRPIAKDDPLLTTVLFSYLLFSRGIGNILSTPISTGLLRAQKEGKKSIKTNLGFDVGEGRFEWVIMFVGTCFAGAAVVAFVGWAMQMRRGRERR